MTAASTDLAAALTATLDGLGRDGLADRAAQARRLVADDGVTYGSAAQGWSVDPLPVVLDAAAWAGLARGLTERAELLDAVLDDLYGRRVLLREGVVPPEAVLGHPGFLRAADGVRTAGPHQLFLVASDLGRTPSGEWVVLSDRTQAPSGAGYAMENRRVVSRVLPGLYRDTPLERLRGFFHTMRAGLQEVAPLTAEAPRVVILTPGAGTETAFDQAFLATLLGYPLVEGQDLTVRHGRVWMRSLGRLEPVDVVLRRVDAWFCDPLELRPDSTLGVPGLLEAARAGTVSVVNPLGSAVLENPALLPFLPAAERLLLGRDSTLAAVPTFWCGDDVSRRHVLAALDRLVLRPVARGAGRASLFGWELSRREREDLRRRIEADPTAWCGQDAVDLGTAPVVVDDGTLEDRHLVLRSFAVAQGGGYRLMSGGLARVAAEAGNRLVTSASGAPAKDVWVLSAPAGPAAGTPEPQETSPPVQLPLPLALTPAATGPGLAPRVAEDLFWLGRYAERAEQTARLLRVVDDLAEDYGRRTEGPGSQALTAMLAATTHVTSTYPGFLAQAAIRGDVTGSGPRADLQRDLLALAVDAWRPGTLGFALRRTVDAAQAVRDQLSVDTWLVLGSLDAALADLSARADTAGAGDEPPLQPTLARVLEGLLALAGLGAESMVRDTGWFFMDLGRRVERALAVLSLLRATVDVARTPAVELLVLEAVLVTGESVITYRRSARSVNVAGVLDLLLLDRTNPRAVAHQFDRMDADLRHLPDQGGGLDRALRAVSARLREVDPAATGSWADQGGAPDRSRLVADLDTLLGAVAGLARDVELVHFVHGAPLRTMPLATPGWQ